MNNIIYSNDIFYIEKEENTIPWLKIFTQKNYKELSDCDKKTKNILFGTIDIIEKSMIEFYNPTKINIAIFGNYLPRLHIHIMARFKDDSKTI